MVVNEVFSCLFLSELFQWICPENVAHKTVGGRFAEAIDLNELAKTAVCATLKQLTLLMSSNVCNSGLRPPCIHKNCLFITAANGKAQKDSIHASYTFSEYLCLHSSLKVK